MEPTYEEYNTSPKKRLIQIFADLSPKKKIALYLSLGLFLIFSILIVSSINNKKSSDNRTPKTSEKTLITEKPIARQPSVQPTLKPTSTPEPTESISDISTQSVLYIEPSDLKTKVGQEQTVLIYLEHIPVAAVDIILKYDPAKIEVLDLQNGEIFKRIIRNQIKDGKIIYSASIDPSEKDNITTGKIFSIKIKALETVSETPIEFDEQETITALAGRNTLGQARGAKLAIDL